MARRSPEQRDSVPATTGSKPATRRLHPGKQRDPDPSKVAALYSAGRTERDIARELGVSRERVARSLAAAGLERRSTQRPCPVGEEELRRLVEEGATQAELAGRFRASAGTVCRWLAEAGIGTPDSRIDHARLRRLYVEERRTTREVAAEFGVSHNRVIRELALAGIERRSRHDRQPKGARAELTDARLFELYVKRGMTLREICEFCGVSDEYLRKRLRACGLVKRPGSFRPKLVRDREELTADAAELYEAGLNLREVADEVGVSASLVREILHEAGVAVRPPPGSGSERHLLRDLLRDPVVLAVLRRFDVDVRDPAAWARPGPFDTLVELPIPEGLLRALYVDVGLSAYHVALVCGVGTMAVATRLRAVGIDRRAPGPSPWTLRTYP